MKRTRFLLLSGFILFGFVLSVFTQGLNIGQSSEWEATGFNNGRRVVRDCSIPGIGFYHYVWHSQPNTYSLPAGTYCHVYYACTDEFGNIVIPPTNMTQYLPFKDNRYPSIAIENDGLDNTGYWRQFNTLHVVWQAILPCGGAYEVYHAKIPVGNPPAPPVQPWMALNIKNLSQTPETNSLVPAICINKYYPVPETNQHIHVVWQEENITGYPGMRGSDILYTRSTDSGQNFSAPFGPAVYPWSNLTNNVPNSQMPSISCSLDTFFGFPLDYSGGDCDYASSQVHVSYNEDTPSGGINVFYLQSPDDGVTWMPAQNITLFTGGSSTTRDGYSNIAADMMDFVHIVFMRDVWPNDPDGIHYQPGLNPNNVGSYAGPYPGLYNALNNQVIYWSNTPAYVSLPVMGPEDREFPTVCLDRYQSVSINWQEYIPGGPYEGDYEIMRIFNQNNQAPSRPLAMPSYLNWSPAANDSQDSSNDDLFPNLAHKKASMYQLNFPAVPGYTESWTKTTGHGVNSAILTSPKTIMMSNNVSRDPAVN